MNGTAADFQALPDDLKKLLRDDSWQLVYHHSKARTYLVERADGTRSFLKIQAVGSPDSLQNQKDRLEWLQGKLPVPAVLYYGAAAASEYLLTSEMKGQDAASRIFEHRFGEIVRLAAEGLRRMHRLPAEDCPYSNKLDKQLPAAIDNCRTGQVNSEELLAKFGTSDTEALVREMQRLAETTTEDVVFTHGDYSMPNIMIDGDRISGFIDLGNCGAADRYLDLAIAEASIIRNCGPDYVDSFYRAYGIVRDPEKVRLYQWLDCFVWV